jgi:phosphate transport system protein
LDELDPDLARQVFDADTEVNEMRSKLEEECFTLIATQQPAAGDLRAIIAVMNMIVDLERMGDQAKGIAKVIPYLTKDPKARLPELKKLGDMVKTMLHQGMTAYANNDVDLARQVVEQDDEADKLYAQISTQIMQQMAQTEDTAKVEANYKVLRAAREMERFGDLATHIGERVIYKVTGQFS